MCKEENGRLIKDYRLEDGSLKCRIAMSAYNGKKGAFIGKTIHVEFEDTGVIVKQIEISSISMKAVFEFSRI